MSLFLSVPDESKPIIGAKTPTLFLGSCFSTEIGNRMKDAGMPCAINPYGTLFNPISILKNVSEALKNPDNNQEESIYHDGEFFHSWNCHSDLSNPEKSKLIESVQEAHRVVRNILTQGDCILILTFGSSYVHEHHGQIVSNCHKAPSHFFNTRFLDQDEIVSSFQKVKDIIPASVKVVLTISPVRHSKIGLHNNSISKGILHAAVNSICEKFPDVLYFPSYEIVMDELRDYRYFDTDLVHPNKLAVDIVWQRFVDSCGKEDFKERISIWKKVEQAQRHIIRFPETPSAQKFIKRKNEMLESYIKKYINQS